MLNDGSRFVLEYFPILSTSCLQVYSSALLFASSDTLIRKSYIPQLPQITIQFGDYPRRSWDQELQTLHGHSDCVVSTAFSPVHNVFVSGSFDSTIRLGRCLRSTYEKVIQTGSCRLFPPVMAHASHRDHLTRLSDCGMLLAERI